MQRIFKRGENKSVRSKTSKLFIRRPYVLPGDYHGCLNKAADYSMLETGVICSPDFKYNPDLVWYLIDSEDDRYLLRKVDVVLQTNYEDDSFKDPDAYGSVVGVKISVIQGGSSGRLLGVKSEIDQLEGSTFSTSNILLDSTKSAAVARDSTEFRLKSKYERDDDYSISYTRLGGDGVFFHQDLNVDVYPGHNHSTLVNFGAPGLIYFGDVNNDGVSDAIISSNNLPEGCGVEWEYHLFVSSEASISTGLQHSVIGTNAACN
jgi:hypothetical protein